MKKSNVILSAMIVLLLLFGVLYLMPVREGVKANARNVDLMNIKNVTKGKNVKPVSSNTNVANVKHKKNK